MTPFSLQMWQSNVAAPTTRVTAVSQPVPANECFVVEHLSGYFAVGTGWPVDAIWAGDGTGNDVHLPTHFQSRPLNWGGAFGVGCMYQFGSPMRMYVDAGRALAINGDANVAGEIRAVAIGHLIPM